MVAAGTAWHNVVESLHRYIVSVLHAKHTHTHKICYKSHTMHELTFVLAGLQLVHIHTRECQKAIHRLVSSPSCWFDAFKSRGSVKFGTEKLEKKKKISHRHSSTGYHVVARQKLYFLFL